MPNAPTPAVTPPGPPPPDRRPPAWRRVATFLVRFTHFVIRTAWTLCVVALCLLLYLWVVGFPEVVKDRVVDRLDTAPFQLAVDHVILDPTEGLVARGVYLYRDGDFSEPLARAESVTLDTSWRRTLRGDPGVHVVRLKGGSLRLPSWQADAAAERVALSGLDGTVLIEPASFRVPELSARLWGFQVAASGTVVRPPAAPGGEPWRELAAFLDGLQQAPARVPEVITELTSIRYRDPAHAHLAFAIDPARRDAWRVRATVDTGRMWMREAEFDSLHAEAELRGHDLTLPEATLGAGGRRCHVTASLNLTSRVVEARMYSDLPPAPWIAMMPKPWQSALRSAGIEVSGSMRSEMWTGPAPLEHALHALGGWVSIEQARVRGLWLEKGYVSLTASSNQVAFNHLSALAGLGPGRGPAEGSFVWHRAERRVDGSLSLHLDPNELIPLLSSNQARVVRRFTFPGPAPLFTGRFQHWLAEPDRLQLQGRITASNCTYRGVELLSLATDLQHSNQTLRLDPWHITRPEGETHGWLALNFSNHLYRIDLESTMAPLAVAGLVGPRLHDAMAAWTFQGPTRLHAYGVVDSEDGESRTDLALDVEGQRMGRAFLLADRATFQLRARGGTYEATNLAGTVHGGPFTGTVRVFRDPASTNHRFEVTAIFTNASLAGLVAARLKDDRELTGLVSGALVVSGLVEQVNGPATRGHGHLRVQEGTVLRLPVLGGLSRLLSLIYPGLGFASQTDFSCTFRIREGAFHTDDARLEGDVLSMKADGWYALDGSVRFKVQVQLLRRGPLAAVLRFVTMPVTKLLEFQLSGTLDDPRWRPVNLPKELFLIFE